MPRIIFKDLIHLKFSVLYIAYIKIKLLLKSAVVYILCGICDHKNWRTKELHAAPCQNINLLLVGFLLIILYILVLCLNGKKILKCYKNLCF